MFSCSNQWALELLQNSAYGGKNVDSLMCGNDDIDMCSCCQVFLLEMIIPPSENWTNYALVSTMQTRFEEILPWT